MKYWMRLFSLPMFDADGGGAAGSAGDAGAAGVEAGADQGSQAGAPDTTEQGAEHKPGMFTQNDVDRIIATRLAQEQKRTDERIKRERTEAERLAKMDAEQRAEHERKMREIALQERENEITRRELRAQAAEQLSTKGMPGELLDVLDFTDADKCRDSMDKVEKAFRRAVQAGVDTRLRGSPPKSGGTEQSAQQISSIFGNTK